MRRLLQVSCLVSILIISLLSIQAQDTDTPATFESPIVLEDAFTLFSEDPAIERERGNRYLNAGAVIPHEGEFHMISNFFNSWPGTTTSYYHQSDDGAVWNRVGEEAVFTVSDVPLEGRGALALSGLVEADGTWVIYYHTFTSGSSAGFIGRATASSPEGPWIFDEDPVLSPGSEGEWDDLQVMRVNVIAVDEGYVMYYAGVDSETSRIGMATSEDGINWVKYDDPTTTDAPYAESDPIMEATDGWEGTRLGRPEVVRTDDGWVMLYEGDRGSKTGIAVSQDGINFSRYAQNPVFTAENMAGRSSFFQGAFYHADDTYYYLIEAGNGRIGTDIYLYTLEGSIMGEAETSAPDRPFVFSSHYGGPPAGQWDTANAEAFFAEYPDLETQIIKTDYYSAYVNQAIHRQITDDTPPDVFSASMGGNLREYARQGLIADISDLWESEGWDEIFPASVKEMATVDGRQYFVPQAIQWNGIFYRKDVMDAAGVELPRTWDELLIVCETLSAADITPFVIPASTSWPPPMGFWFSHINMRLNGPDFHDALMQGEIAYTDKRVMAVFDHWMQLFDAGCFADNAFSVSYNRMVTTWNAGDAAMNAHGEWLYEFISDDAKDNTGHFPFPIIDNTLPVGELVPMYGAFMMADTPYPDVARDFLIQMAGVDSQTTNMMDIQRLPSNLTVDRSALRPIYEDGLQLVQDADYITTLIGSNTHPDVALSLYGLLGQFWRNPENIDRHIEQLEAARQRAYGDIISEVAVQFSLVNADPIIARDAALSNRLEPGAVIYHDGQFHMFINRFDRFPADVTVTYATSPDAITWTENSDAPILTTADVPFADIAITVTDVLIEDDGTWVLYFHTWQTTSLRLGDGVIGRATASSPDGEWTVDPQPVLSMADSADAWDSGQVSIADVVRDGDVYRMYYTGASKTGLMQMGLATSDDGIIWTRHDDPVVTNGDAGEWDERAAFNGRVVAMDDGWLMIYKNIGSRTERPVAGMAVSVDGITWHKTESSPIFGSDIVEDGTWIGMMTLLTHDDEVLLFSENYTDSRSLTDMYLFKTPLE